MEIWDEGIIQKPVKDTEEKLQKKNGETAGR